MNLRASLLFVRARAQEEIVCDEVVFETGYVSRVVTLRRSFISSSVPCRRYLQGAFGQQGRALLLCCCQRGRDVDRAGLAHHKLPTQAAFWLPSLSRVPHPAASTHEIPPVDDLLRL